MTTSSINHRRTTHAAAVIGLVGTLLAITLNSAYAMPGHDHSPTGSDPAADSHAYDLGHSCFLTPNTWNEALAGPLPRCYTYVP